MRVIKQHPTWFFLTFPPMGLALSCMMILEDLAFLETRPYGLPLYQKKQESIHSLSDWSLNACSMKSMLGCGDSLFHRAYVFTLNAVQVLVKSHLKRLTRDLHLLTLNSAKFSFRTRLYIDGGETSISALNGIMSPILVLTKATCSSFSLSSLS